MSVCWIFHSSQTNQIYPVCFLLEYMGMADGNSIHFGWYWVYEAIDTWKVSSIKLRPKLASSSQNKWELSMISLIPSQMPACIKWHNYLWSSNQKSEMIVLDFSLPKSKLLMINSIAQLLRAFVHKHLYICIYIEVMGQDQYKTSHQNQLRTSYFISKP